MNSPALSRACRMLALGIIIGGLFAGSACRSADKSKSARVNGDEQRPGATQVITTPATMQVGYVAHVNPKLRYVVLEFAGGTLPQPDQRMNLYRKGIKVGEVKITGPSRNNNTAGDVTLGEAQVGDTVKLD